MLFYGIAAGCEALAGLGGWNEALYRTWYLTGAVGPLAGSVWARRSCWVAPGSATASRCASSWRACSRSSFGTVRNTPGAGALPLLYFIAAGVLALAVAVETYFQNERWPSLAAGAVVGATVLSLVLMATTTIAPPGYAVDEATGMPVGDTASRRTSGC